MLHRPPARDDRGFTLVELLVVMIIIGILAAVAIPVFLQQRVKAVDTTIRADLRSLATEVDVYRVDNAALMDSAAGMAYLSTKDAAALAGPSVKILSSSGNEVQFKALGQGGYCLRGWNPKGSTTGTGTGTAGTYFFFDSRTGGLVTGAARTTSTYC